MVPTPQFTHSLEHQGLYPELPSTRTTAKGSWGSKNDWQLAPPDPEPLTSWYWRLYKSWQLLKIYSYVEFKQAFTQSFTTWLALGGLCSSCTCQLIKNWSYTYAYVTVRVLLTWVVSPPRTAPKLFQIPSSLCRSLDLALGWNCQDSWWGELPSPTSLTHGLLRSNSGTDTWKCGLKGDKSYSLWLCPVILILHDPVARSLA